MSRSWPLGKFTVRMPSRAEYRPASLDSVLPSNFSVTSPTLGDLRSTLARKHHPLRSRPLNRLRKPGSGCQSSAWTTVASETDRRATSDSCVLMDVILKIIDQGHRFVTIPGEWPFQDVGSSMISVQSRRNKGMAHGEGLALPVASLPLLLRPPVGHGKDTGQGQLESWK